MACIKHITIFLNYLNDVESVSVELNGEGTIYYTTDGSYPDGRSIRYTGPFPVEDGTVIRAVAAWKLNGSRSPMSTAKWERTTAAG